MISDLIYLRSCTCRLPTVSSISRKNCANIPAFFATVYLFLVTSFNPSSGCIPYKNRSSCLHTTVESWNFRSMRIALLLELRNGAM